jgi:hypothetical protein
VTDWKHAERAYSDEVCAVKVRSPQPTICGCTTPTPDPASPCGYVGCLAAWHCDGTCPAHDRSVILHPHVPTLCTCGHALVAA